MRLKAINRKVGYTIVNVIYEGLAWTGENNFQSNAKRTLFKATHDKRKEKNTKYSLLAVPLNECDDYNEGLCFLSGNSEAYRSKRFSSLVDRR